MGKEKKRKPPDAASQGVNSTLTLAISAGGGVLAAVGLAVLVIGRGNSEAVSHDPAMQESAPSDPDACECGDAWAPPSAAAFEQFEYARGCDFDVVDEFPTQADFDRLYWNRRPLLVRNGTATWPARSKWSKAFISAQLGGGGWGAAWFKASDEHASFKISDYFKKNSEVIATPREKMDVSAFFCHGVCQSGLEQGDQTYLFDRDEWRRAAPHLEEDTIAPAPLMAHYDAAWHERWSKYLLISAEGSGINFHRHTNAFNGLVVGRKRWFLYPPDFDMDRETEVTGALHWFQRIYQPRWAAAKAGTAGRNGLEQCMQGEGDLIYVPQHWWHATIALGEGIGLSGQYVRRLAEILRRVQSMMQEGHAGAALAELEFLLEHADEIEAEVAIGIAVDVAELHHSLGRTAMAVKAARFAVERARQYTQKLHHVTTERLARANEFIMMQSE